MYRGGKKTENLSIAPSATAGLKLRGFRYFRSRFIYSFIALYCCVVCETALWARVIYIHAVI